MIITKDFIFINFPKTGSTFVRSVLKRLHQEKWWQKKLRYPFSLAKTYHFNVKTYPELRTYNRRYNKPTEHGLYSQIEPELLSNKKIVSVKRNIFDYYLSLYFYADWKRPEAMNIPLNDIRRQFPDFPDLSFEQFVHFRRDFPFYFGNPKIKNEKQIQKKLGPLSVQFVFFFFHNPFDFLNTIDQYDIHHLHYGKLMPQVIFLDQQNLNNELFTFLKQYYPEEKIKFILNEKKKNISNQNKLTVQDISEDVKNLILKDEDLVINYFNNTHYV